MQTPQMHLSAVTCLRCDADGSAPVVDAVRVAVRQAVQQLLEDASPRSFRERAIQGDLLKQFAAGHQLQHDIHLRKRLGQ